MTKEELKEKTLYIIEKRVESYKKQMELVIDNMKEDDIESFEDNYFLPKAFYDALYDMNNEYVTSRSYSMSYVRSYKRSIRFFQSEIFDIMPQYHKI